MDAILNTNFCKLFFVIITTSMIILSFLINYFEPYLPVFITKTFRYGKYACNKDSLLLKSAEIPKSYFRHFYLTSGLFYYPTAFYQVFCVYLLNCDVSDWITTLLNFSCGHNRKATVSATRVFIAIILLMLQTSRRFYDTYFVSVFSKKAKINLSHYLIGMIYYPALMLIILSEAPKFAYNDSDAISDNIEFSKIGFTELFAVILFLWSWYHQYISNVILANLRKDCKGNLASEDYKIPEGDWFCYLSSPHSTAEILIYTALTILLSDNTSWWYVYAWVLCNQVETILLSHWWYQSYFKNFPNNRKALIPFVY